MQLSGVSLLFFLPLVFAHVRYGKENATYEHLTCSLCALRIEATLFFPRKLQAWQKKSNQPEDARLIPPTAVHCRKNVFGINFFAGVRYVCGQLSEVSKPFFIPPPPADYLCQQCACSKRETGGY